MIAPLNEFFNPFEIPEWGIFKWQINPEWAYYNRTFIAER
jgi:hypothetical protein